jgi:hypothetical protein
LPATAAVPVTWPAIVSMPEVTAGFSVAGAMVPPPDDEHPASTSAAAARAAAAFTGSPRVNAACLPAIGPCRQIIEGAAPAMAGLQFGEQVRSPEP